MTTTTVVVEREALTLEPGPAPGLPPRWSVRVPGLPGRFWADFRDGKLPGRAGQYVVRYHPDDQFAHVVTRTVEHVDGADLWSCACAECAALRTDANEAVRS